jgi:hypothetical protein
MGDQGAACTACITWPPDGLTCNCHPPYRVPLTPHWDHVSNATLPVARTGCTGNRCTAQPNSMYVSVWACCGSHRRLPVTQARGDGGAACGAPRGLNGGHAAMATAPEAPTVAWSATNCKHIVMACMWDDNQVLHVWWRPPCAARDATPIAAHMCVYTRVRRHGERQLAGEAQARFVGDLEFVSVAA